jgi:cysteine-rich repeat protein
LIVKYTDDNLAILDSPLSSAVTVASTYSVRLFLEPGLLFRSCHHNLFHGQLYQAYSIYQDLGTSCLNNVAMRVTYTVGTTKLASNDPGGLDPSLSAWDGIGARRLISQGISAQSVRSWIIVLQGDGYYNNFNPAQGAGSMAADGTVLTAAVLVSNTTITVGSAAGISVGMYLRLTDRNISSPKVEIVRVLAVKISPAPASVVSVTVSRGQLNTAATAFSITPPSMGYVEPYYRVPGSGYDEMSNFGGTSRPTSSMDGAYSGLNITIIAGTGTGQTRLIVSYHGSSRTAFIDNPWTAYPDTTSKYRIWSTSEIQAFDTTSTIAIVTYPQPVKKGYVYEVFWYGCTAAVPENYGISGSEQVRGLPLCKGSLAMRIPKMGPVQVYQQFDVMKSDTVGGILSAVSGAILTLAPPAVDIDGFYVGRLLTVKTAGAVQSRLIVGYSKNRQATVEAVYTVYPTITSTFQIEPLPGTGGRTTVSSGQDKGYGATYIAQEVDVVREEYPELIAQHRLWPHGYSYLQLRAGEDGEFLANLFLKDYTQYSTSAYFTDSVTIPKEKFEAYVRQQPNGVVGEFPFTIKTPPGKGNIQLISFVFGYPVSNEKDATAYDVTDIETKALQSSGPPPLYPMSGAWSGVDPENRNSATHPRFKTHHYTSTCGNGKHDAGEYCDDGNEVDGDGCSSACMLEPGWICSTLSLNLPSHCVLGAQGSHVPDQAIGCKAYACQHASAAYLLSGKMCSGTVSDSAGNYIACLDANSLQGTCNLCIHWETERNLADVYSGLDSSNVGPLVRSGATAPSNQRFAGYDGRRRLMAEEMLTDSQVDPLSPNDSDIKPDTALDGPLQSDAANQVTTSDVGLDSGQKA